jgi:AbrB family looped-hinge helix DNA binding protein
MAGIVTSKCQVTMPKKVRDRPGITAGSTLDFELTDAGEVVLRALGRGGMNRSARALGSRFAKLRWRATVRMRTEETLALIRGE